ncbi:MAG: hypothetical protein ACYCUI_16610 [Vulcanimicrobiaceae bacterium]
MIMPYIRPIKREELLDIEKQAAIKKAAINMVMHGLHHDDMNLRHVGFVSPK